MSWVYLKSTKQAPAKTWTTLRPFLWVGIWSLWVTSVLIMSSTEHTFRNPVLWVSFMSRHSVSDHESPGTMPIRLTRSGWSTPTASQGHIVPNTPHDEQRTFLGTGGGLWKCWKSILGGPGPKISNVLWVNYEVAIGILMAALSRVRGGGFPKPVYGKT